MKRKAKFNIFVAGICMAALASTAHAEEPALNLEFPAAASFYTNNFQSLRSHSYNSPAYLLAENEAGVFQGQPDVAPVTPAANFEPPLMSGRKAHQYLGLGTVALAGLTILAAPDEGCEENCPPPSQQPPRQTSGTTHTRLARATAAMAVATVMTGLLYHWDDIHWEDPFTDPDKMHARLAAAGALLMVYAVNKSAKSAVPVSHAGMAELGAAAMLVAIKLTW